MSAKCGRLVLIAVAAVAASLGGCEQSERVVVVPPPPLPQYLSRDLAPEGRPASQTTSETAKLSPEMAAQIREVEEAVERLQQKASSVAERPTAAREGESPAPVSVEVPMEAEQPLRRTGDSAAPAGAGVALTGVRPLEEGELAPPAEEEAPVPPPAEQGVKKPPDEAPAAPAAREGETETGPMTLAALTRHYEALAAKSPGDVEIARSLRMLHFLAGEDEKSLEPIAGLPADEQKVWRGLVWAMINARDRPGGMSRAGQAAEVLDAVEDVREALKRQAPLELGEVRFCERVKNFGNYDAVATSRFHGRQAVWLYCEVRNFVSEKGEDGRYRVRLNERLSLENADGVQVWQEAISNIEDVCRQPRQDFFLTTPLVIPGDVPPGRYALRVTIEDAVAQKSVGARMELEVVAAAAP